jgi:phosphoglycolate phosphatase
MTRPAILFDLDGTLVDSAADITRALSAIREGRGAGPIAAEDVRPLVSQGAATVVALGLGPAAGEPARDLAEFREALRGLPIDPSIIYPEVIDALEMLAAAGHPMAVVTNKPEGLARVLLEGLNLSRFFAAIVGGDTAPMPKPDPAPIFLALDLLGAGSPGAMLIGDSPVDAGAARAAGLPFLLYEAGYDPQGCKVTNVAGRFSRFGALPALVASIAGIGSARTSAQIYSR